SKALSEPHCFIWPCNERCGKAGGIGCTAGPFHASAGGWDWVFIYLAIQRDEADFVSVSFGEPHLAVWPCSKKTLVINARAWQRVFGELAIHSDPGNILGLAFAKPECAIWSQSNTERQAIDCGDIIFNDETADVRVGCWAKLLSCSCRWRCRGGGLGSR